MITEGDAAAAPRLRRAVDVFLGGQASRERLAAVGPCRDRARPSQLWDVDSWARLEHPARRASPARRAHWPRWSACAQLPSGSCHLAW